MDVSEASSDPAPTAASSPAATRAVLVAAGSSRRMAGAGGAKKPLVDLGGRTVLERACARFAGVPGLVEIVVLAHPDDRDEVERLLARMDANRAETGAGAAPAIHVVPGGAERADSVRIGCELDTGTSVDLVCIHDAARPFVRPGAVAAVVAAAQRDGGALLAVPVRDTLKRSDDGERVADTVDRSHLWAAQTPQVFERGRFLECLASAARDGLAPTDDAALWERYVGPVTIVPGSPTNFKITGPDDLELARALVASLEKSPS